MSCVDGQPSPPPPAKPLRKSRRSVRNSANLDDTDSNNRHSSISTEICDLIDTNKKLTKKSSLQKIKVLLNTTKDENENENDELHDPFQFSYATVNALRHVFNLLDCKSTKTGRVAKSRLQVICATVCMVYGCVHDADDLDRFQGDKTYLTFNGLIFYLSTVLAAAYPLYSGGRHQSVDERKIELTAWAIISKEGKESVSTKLGDDTLFKLWQVFNKLISDDSTTVHIEEISLLLRDFSDATGCVWDARSVGSFTEHSRLSFWEFVKCLEAEYLCDIPEGVYNEGVDRLCKKYVCEILKEGWLQKRGHRVKNVKDRWIVFTPHLITYYETQLMQKKKGEIVINSNSTVDNIADSKTTRCRFDVTCGLTKTLYEFEANDQRTKNEWINLIKNCIGLNNDVSPLMLELSERADKRMEKQQRELEEEMERNEQLKLVNQQRQELEKTRLALDEAQIQVETETALRDEERRKRVEMEELKAEYERMLQEEKRAREEENAARLRQEEVLGEETTKRLELERIKQEQDEILRAEREMREGLEELSKEQNKVLDKERERLRELEEAQKLAESELADAHLRLEASEKASRDAACRVEEAKQRTRLMTGAGGLNKIIALSRLQPVTHRGVGAFVDEDFSKTPTYLQSSQPTNVVNRTPQETDDVERVQVVETNLIKPSEGRDTFENTPSVT